MDYAIQNVMISATLKIFLNYSQSITIINYLNLDWKILASHIMPFYKVSSGNVSQMMALECFVSSIVSTYFNFIKFIKRFNLLLQNIDGCLISSIFWRDSAGVLDIL